MRFSSTNSLRGPALNFMILSAIIVLIFNKKTHVSVFSRFILPLICFKSGIISTKLSFFQESTFNVTKAVQIQWHEGQKVSSSGHY